MYLLSSFTGKITELLSSFTGKITEWIQLLCEIVHTNLKINIYLSVDFILYNYHHMFMFA